MAGALVPCVSCSRHVRTSEPACPFCGAAVVELPRPHVAASLLPRIAAAAALMAAAAAAGLTSCADGSVASAYGAFLGSIDVDASPPKAVSIGGSAGALQCTSAANCSPGHVCCGNVAAVTSNCQGEPCPLDDAGEGQLCAFSAECPLGDTCVAQNGTPPLAICSPADAGIDDAGEAGDDQGDASDAEINDANDSPSDG